MATPNESSICRSILSGRVFRWPTQADRPFMESPIDHPFNRNSHASEPGFQVVRGGYPNWCKSKSDSLFESTLSSAHGNRDGAVRGTAASMTTSGRVAQWARKARKSAYHRCRKKRAHIHHLMMFKINRLRDRSRRIALNQTTAARRRVRSINQAWMPVAAGPVASSAGWLCT